MECVSVLVNISDLCSTHSYNLHLITDSKMNTLLLEDPFEDVFTLDANSYLSEKIER